MKILVACEFSGIVRDAFAARGHDAWSCDLMPSETVGKHFQADALTRVLHAPFTHTRWNLIIAHPPCTHLSVSGARWFPAKRADGSQQRAIDFFMAMVSAPCERICVENPICIMSRIYRKPDQIIQPWMFGHGETKATCLWLKNLPKLVSTDIVSGRENQILKMGPSPTRAQDRSRTYAGIANAMAAQWGILPV